jgi:hypothetical protein
MSQSETSFVGLQFIAKATGQGEEYIGHGLISFTVDFRCVKVQHKGREIVLVDTPPFDDTERSDAEVLGYMAGWLKET